MSGFIPERVQGCLPVPHAAGAGDFPVMTEAQIVRDRDRWTERLGAGLIKPHVFQIARQQFNNCATVAAKNALQIVRHQRNGDTTELSETFCYQLVNGGRDAGSTIAGNLKALAEVGTVPAAVYPDHTWRRRHTEAMRDEAAGYQLREWLDLPDFDAAVSSILWYAKPVTFGVRWGWGGHAIVGVDVVARDGLPAGTLQAWDELVSWLDGEGFANQAAVCGPAGADRIWLEILNSWGTSYGTGGFGYLPESQVAAGIRDRYGAWGALTATHTAEF